jgi:hypothetical protein
MKKLDTSNIVPSVRGLGGSKQTLDHVQESIQESLSYIVKGLVDNNITDFIVLYGCVNSGSGLNYNISAGAIFYLDEVYEVPAFVATATGSDVPVLMVTAAYRAGDPVK